MTRWVDSGAALQLMPWLDTLRHSADPEEVLLAARAWRQLGADRAADALTLRLGRRHPHHAAAQVSMLRTVLGNRGNHAFWLRSRQLPWPAHAGDSDRADWLSLQGLWLAQLREAEQALDLQRQALALAPDDPWLWVEHSHALGHLDRREAALGAARQALALSPGYRTAVLQTARLLQELRRPDEARAVLEPALQATGGAWFAWMLHGLAVEAGEHAQALQLLDQASQAMPHAEANWQTAFAMRRTDACLRLGRLAEARALAAGQPATGFYGRLVQRLDAAAAANDTVPPPRTVLPLAMVQQHWMTCAPATLTALAGFWGRSADHLEVAQAICYDGTPQTSERIWAQSEGFVVRECKLDWPTSCALVRAGIPFALATQYVASGHLQAVVGFDPLRETLLVRDPSQPLHAEYEASVLFESQQSGGPRAMVMLPPEQLHRLQGIDLPEADAWDLSHAFMAALQRHDRAAAQASLEQLQSKHPGSDSTWRTTRHLAMYDGDEPRILAATETLLQRFPDDRNLQLSRLASLYAVQGQAAGDAWLAQLVQRRDVDVALLVRWSEQLARDARRLPLALATVRQALRRDGTHARAWSALAGYLWIAQGAAAALQPLRWAGNLQPTDEWMAAEYARACRVAGEAETGLAWLRARVETWGDRSGQPALTLAEALDSLQRGTEAQDVLDAALQRRAQDNPLRLAMAERRLMQHRLDEADELLRACTQVHAPAQLRLQAQLHEARGALPQALASAREAAALEPLQLANHRLLLRLLRRSHGDAQALALWRPLADAHPAHIGLQQLLYEALPDEPVATNTQLAHMRQQHPELPWLQRELAIQASRQDLHGEAVALARSALAATPRDSTALDVLSFCLLRKDGYAAALPQLQAAIVQDAEHEGAVLRLLDAPDVTARRAAMHFWIDQLHQQVLLGDGLLHLQSEGPRTWSDAEVLAELRSLCTRWPAHWQGPVAHARQLLRMQQPAQALDLLTQAAERFPQLPRVHLELGDALRLDGRTEEALAANARTLALGPGWNRAVRLQVELLGQDAQRWPQAEQVIQQAIENRHAWNDADLVGLLAWVQQRQERDDEAFATARRALLLDPRQAWVWQLVRRHCEKAETPAAFEALLAEVVQSRPGDAEAWLVRAEQASDDETALDASVQALRLQPRHAAAWNARLQRLARLERFDEAGQCLAALPWPDAAPLLLRAWAPQCLWLQGQHAAAIDGLRALCAEAPEDEALCVRLADWLDARDDHPGYLAQAQALMAIAPLEARSHLYLGHALSKSGRWAEALPPLQRALALQPGYTFAARALVHAAREAKQPALAEPALQALWPHRLDVATACDGMEAAAAAGNAQHALAWLQRLMALDEFATEPVQRALGACRTAGWAETMAPLIQAHVARGGGPVGVPLDWLLQRSTQRGVWRAFADGCRLQRHAEGPGLLLALLHWSTDRRSRAMLRLLMWRFEAPLRQHAHCWGEVSYALVQHGEFAGVRRWLRDWRARDRQLCPPYAMANLAGGLAVLRRWKELEEVVHATLARAPQQEDMRLWQLLCHAWRADASALQAGLARCHEWTPQDWMKAPLQALRAFAQMESAHAGGDSLARLRRLLHHRGPPQALALQRQLRLLAWRRTPWHQRWRWAFPT
jgi:tetratricopeptide (TPR) repeat protein